MGPLPEQNCLKFLYLFSFWWKNLPPYKLYLLYAQTNSDNTILWTQEKFLGSSTFLFSTLKFWRTLRSLRHCGWRCFSMMPGSTQQQMSSLELNFFCLCFFYRGELLLNFQLRSSEVFSLLAMVVVVVVEGLVFWRVCHQVYSIAQDRRGRQNHFWCFCAWQEISICFAWDFFPG